MLLFTVMMRELRRQMGDSEEMQRFIISATVMQVKLKRMNLGSR